MSNWTWILNIKRSVLPNLRKKKQSKFVVIMRGNQNTLKKKQWRFIMMGAMYL